MHRDKASYLAALFLEDFFVTITEEGMLPHHVIDALTVIFLSQAEEAEVDGYWIGYDAAKKKYGGAA